MTGTLERRHLLQTLGGGLVGTVATSSVGATRSNPTLTTTGVAVEYNWDDGTKQGWEKVVVDNGNTYRYGLDSNEYEFAIIDDVPITGEYSPQIECLNDGIYVQSPDLSDKLDGELAQEVSARFRLTGDLDASDWNNNRFRVNDEDGESNGYVRFDHEDRDIKWVGAEDKVLTSFESGTIYEVAIRADDETFTVTIDGDEYTELLPDDGQETSIHTVEMRSRNWGGVGPSAYDDSIYFTWDEFRATTDISDDHDDDDDDDEGDDGSDSFDDFEDGLDCWDTSGNVEVVSDGVVGDRSMRLDDATRSGADWECAGVFNTHDTVEFRGIYRVTESAFQQRFRLNGDDDERHLLINTSRDAIYFASGSLDSPGAETIDNAFANTWAVFRLYLDGGTVSAKVWEFGTSEPSEWQLSDSISEFDFEFRAGVGGNDHDRELLVDEVQAITDPSEELLEEPYNETEEEEEEDDGEEEGGDDGEEEPELRIESVTPEEPTIQPHDTVDIDFDVRNAGDVSVSQTVTVELEGDTIETLNVGLDGGDLAMYSIPVGPVEARGEHEFTIESANDAESGVISVEGDSAEIALIGIDDPSHAVTLGDSIVIPYVIENQGDVATSATIDFTFAGDDVESTEIDLDPGNYWEHEYVVTADSPGEHEFSLETGDDSYTGEVTVVDEEVGDDDDDDESSGGTNNGDGTDDGTSGDDSGGNEEGGDDEVPDSGDSDDDDSDVVIELETDEVPGPGIIGTVASLGGVTYLLKRRADASGEAED
ncbi:hypothetical protein [Halostagnicola sp. A-GB9-2]|uniref:hypothetical protein n=1 Tax=Halostagnicola sp. A-GB9-2 TaxID=3048066 RepID=UPI0024C0C2D0|nr:hypothetical protein [Halostagnicola sp. A-GB9-2]MDJ1434286.1 hypothetical protein [Halostagnicola sp. A-GB9-2]